MEHIISSTVIIQTIKRKTKLSNRYWLWFYSYCHVNVANWTAWSDKSDKSLHRNFYINKIIFFKRLHHINRLQNNKIGSKIRNRDSPCFHMESYPSGKAITVSIYHCQGHLCNRIVSLQSLLNSFPSLDCPWVHWKLNHQFMTNKIPFSYHCPCHRLCWK